MEVYNGTHLLIKYEKENSRLISIWKSSPPNDLAYRKELIEHLHIAKKIKPSQIIWLLKNLTFKVDDATKKWADENISKPIFKAGFIAKNHDGFDQVVFVVGHDLLAYIEVMGIFDENSTIGFNPKYLATEKDAIHWLNGEFNTKDYKGKNQNLEITFKGTDDNGKVVFDFREQSYKFDGAVNLLKTILDQNNFMKNNIDKYSKLTKREKETLKLIVKGYTNVQIAEKMQVSPHTIRTHRNRIWQKLEIKHLIECLKYAYFFN